MFNKLPGGIGDFNNPKDVDQEQLQKGIEHEMEHTNDPEIAKEIAIDHLTEDPYYYNNFEQDSIKEIFNNWRKFNNKLLEQECKIKSIDLQKNRLTMPQIKPEMIQGFLIFLRERGIQAFKTRVPVAELVGSQSSVDCEKVKNLAALGYEKLSSGTPIFVSQDHIIADGHTRTQALKLIDPNADIAVWEVQCQIGQLLQTMKQFLSHNNA